MTREAIEYFKYYRKIFCEDHLKICPKDSIAYQATLKEKEFYDMAIKALEQETFINKPCCISGEVCEHDKNVVLDKLRAEIEQLRLYKAQFITSDNKVCIDSQEVLNILDKYKPKSEE